MEKETDEQEAPSDAIPKDNPRRLMLSTATPLAILRQTTSPSPKPAASHIGDRFFGTASGWGNAELS
jgi:hypothetical protein